MLNWA
jgi:hypothetical protein